MSDSGASIHMLTRKRSELGGTGDYSVSRIPTTVITASGEVLTHEEATVYVHDLELFVTVQILEDTPAVLSQGKLCEEHGYPHEWASGQKPTVSPKMAEERSATENFVPIVVPGLSTDSSSSTASTSPTSLPQTRLIALRRVQQQHEVTVASIRAWGNGTQDPARAKNTQKNMDIIPASGKRLRDLPEW